jgi:hypothetical protein
MWCQDRLHDRLYARVSHADEAVTLQQEPYPGDLKDVSYTDDTVSQLRPYMYADESFNGQEIKRDS